MPATIVLWSTPIPHRFLAQCVLLHIMFGLLLGLAGCASSTSGLKTAISTAESMGFAAKSFKAGGFELFALQRLAPSPGPLVTVYIEGDGRAWRRRNQPSADPTSHHSIALALALKDPGPAVLYLARPCQFQTHPLPDKCQVSAWTSHRYSEEIIAAMNSAISAAAVGFEQVALVGYSGGGTVAALITARRQDVAWVITIAANLDHRAWTDLHGVSPLTGSLNAADYARAVQHIPQLHLVGGRDRTITPEILQSFVDRMSDKSMTKIAIETEMDHACCWETHWPELMKSLPVISKSRSD